MELQNIRHQKAGIIIGKNGLSEGMVKLVKDFVKKNKLVKIKILKSALSINYSKEDLINELISITDFYVIEKRGYTVIISSSPRNKKQ